ncbi:MAG: hypothetical protein HYZ75_08535 [Elusimicrobia bacterium]|nr:hypothetical protein [Elusimicrobiota bacterium]
MPERGPEPRPASRSGCRGAEARALYRRSIDLYKKLLPYHPGVGDGLAGLAALAAGEKKDAEAVVLETRAAHLRR